MPDMAFLRETGEYRADRLLELVVVTAGTEHVFPLDRHKVLTFNRQIADALCANAALEAG